MGVPRMNIPDNKLRRIGDGVDKANQSLMSAIGHRLELFGAWSPRIE